MGRGVQVRVAWLSDFDLSGSGYLNLSIPLCSGLAARGHEVKVAALGYNGTEHNYNFSLLPAKSMQEALAIAQNLFNLWKFDAFVVALDIPIQEQILYSMQQKPPFKYVGIMPVEADPLCMSWAMSLMQMDKVFVISQFGTDEAIKAGVDATHIQLGIDTKEWRKPTPEERARYREGMGFEEDTFAVLTVADNQERKNLSHALDVFAKFAENKPNARYVFVTRERNPVGWRLRDYATELGISNKVLIIERGMPFKELWSVYVACDLFFLSSKAEGLGMPLLEAMACFPEDVNVEATDILKGMERTYSGELISIEIDGRTIDVTPEHPFWTSDGWQYARDLNVGSQLWYNPPSLKLGGLNAEKRISSTFRGRIEDVVGYVRSYDCQGNSKKTWETDYDYSMAYLPIRNEEGFEKQHKVSFSSFISRGIGIFSRNNRWRRNNYNTKDGRSKTNSSLEANDTDFKHLSASFRVAFQKIRDALNLDWKNRRTQHQSSVLHLLPEWVGTSPNLQCSSSVFSNKERAYGEHNRILRIEAGSGKNRPAYGIPDWHYIACSGAKFKAISKISKRSVEHIKVYNLTTESGCYLAEGFLVHNCGLPIMATDCTAIHEVLGEGRGTLIPYDYMHRDPFGNGKRYWIDRRKALEEMEWLYEQRSSLDLSKAVQKAREYVETRTWDIAVDTLESGILQLLEAK